MSKIFSIATITILSAQLAGCGNGNDQTVPATYAYTQNGYGGHPMCPGQMVQDWANMVAPACSQNMGPSNGMCNQALSVFAQRYTALLQGPGCGIPVSQAGWCPDSWRHQQAYFDLNNGVIQAWLTQNGPGSFPAGGNGGGFPR